MFGGADGVRTYEAVHAAFGHIDIDIVVANAGLEQDAAIADMSLEHRGGSLDVYLTGQFLCARERAPLHLPGALHPFHGVVDSGMSLYPGFRDNG